MNITFKRLSECQIGDIIKAWNRGFEGYFVTMEMTPEIFFSRMVNEGLSFEYSLVAYDDCDPIAIVVNGFREIEGRKTAWNGGTGVASEYRGKGVSQLLMKETLDIYKEQGVEAASLEAIKENEKAIRLYKKYGYKIIDSLVYLTGSLEITNTDLGMTAKTIRPEQLAKLPIYRESVPWQCQWQSVKTGEAQLYYNARKQPVGFALYKKLWNEEGELEKVVLLQLQLLEDTSGEVLPFIFTKIMEETRKPIPLMTVNAPVSSPSSRFLLKHGFTIATEQVLMEKREI